MIHFLKVDVVKDRIDILIDLWFGILSFFNTFPSVYQAKVFQEFIFTFQILWCAATFCTKILGFAAPRGSQRNSWLLHKPWISWQHNSLSVELTDCMKT